MKILVILAFALICSCNKTAGPTASPEAASPEPHASLEDQEKSDTITKPYAEEKNNSFEESRESVETYVITEILNGRKYDASLLDDENGVTRIYGTPLADTVVSIIPFTFEGVLITGLRELTYEDLKHTYFVSDKGGQLYAYVEVSKKNNRLKTINIGDSVEKLIDVFGNHYFKGDGESISYYGLTEEVIFVIENNSIQRIVCYYLLI
ncbi:MAG: hypothetical protein LBG73_00320 [Spirochaetaceae bacterium]|jgi:hypothetical protein|nr:hypothetical protein [Spirochaetaceae bacterium]